MNSSHAKVRSTTHLPLMGLNSGVSIFDFTHANFTFNPFFKFLIMLHSSSDYIKLLSIRFIQLDLVSFLLYDDMKKLPYRRISPVLFVLSLSHDGTPSLLRSITKITRRYATSALTNIGERGLDGLMQDYRRREKNSTASAKGREILRMRRDDAGMSSSPESSRLMSRGCPSKV